MAIDDRWSAGVGMAEGQLNGKPNWANRAPRFEIHAPLRYRPSGKMGWSKGRMENISRSGVLFRAEQLVDVDAQVEMSFVLPVEIVGEGAAEVFCQGTVVRTMLPPTTDAPPALAARILDYRFMREPDETSK